MVVNVLNFEKSMSTMNLCFFLAFCGFIHGNGKIKELAILYNLWKSISNVTKFVFA